MTHYLGEAYAIVQGAPIQPTVEHIKALHEQLHPKQSWCDDCCQPEDRDNLSVVDGHGYCGICAKGKVE